MFGFDYFSISEENKESLKEGNTIWLVDVNLGHSNRISKQHALIIYNFNLESFEIKNLSKKKPIIVNGKMLNYNEVMILNSKSKIKVGNVEFYFMLPII